MNNLPVSFTLIDVSDINAKAFDNRHVKQVAHFTIPYEAEEYYDALAKKMIMLL